jgi:deoxyribonuclease V
MTIPPARHRWNITPEQAIRLQRRLAGEIIQAPLAKPVRFVAGGDISFFENGTRLVAGWVVWDMNDRAIVETVYAVRPVLFPYVPGLLSFREAPAMLAAARRLRREPDVFMLDGQGRAHPRRLGLACHVGLLLDRPALGCAKNRLCGAHPMPAEAPGSRSPLTHEGETIGCVLRTRLGAKPVFVSVGHRLALDDAADLVLRCCTGYRLPEPTRLAHQFVTSEGRRLESPERRSAHAGR